VRTTPVRAPHIAAAILVGGGSRRMGRDKWAVLVEGSTLLERTVASLHEVTGSVTLVGHDATGATAATTATTEHDLSVGSGSERTRPTLRAVPDGRPDGGPLVGLETALLAHPDAEAVLVVGTDHPWLQPAVLQMLVDRLLGLDAHDRGGRRDARATRPEAVMLVTDRGPQPLLAAYRPDTVPAVSALLDGGERRLRTVVDHLDVLAVAPADWRVHDVFGASAVDVDTPDELDRAVRWQARIRATTARPFGPPGHDTPALDVLKVVAGQTRQLLDPVIGEEPLEVRAAGPGQEPIPLMTTLRTPGHEREQAAGWLLAEAFATPDQIVDVHFGDAIERSRPDDTVTVELTRTVDASAGAHRHAVATASCGVCGRASIDELASRTSPVTGDAFRTDPLTWTMLAGLPDELRFAQSRFHATGGVHATGLFDGDGRLVTIREDVGRHNALDAVIGAHVLSGAWPQGGLDDLVCVLSGRIGFELVAKAAVARLPIVAAVGAASDLAVRTADRLGITLVGFVRGGNGTVYTHPDRLVLP
jgi:FdhD protein